jgi:hypothetical protein
MVGRILLVAALAFAGFAALVLIGIWDRYSQETAALGFSGIYERLRASQSGFPNDPSAYRAAPEVTRGRQTGNVFQETPAFEE